MLRISDDKVYIETKLDYGNKSLISTNKLISELFNLGYLVTPELAIVISTNYDSADWMLNQYGIGTLHDPLFKDWQYRETNINDIVLQFLAYVFDISGKDLSDPNFHSRIMGITEPTDFKVISLATIEEVADKAKQLANSKVPLNSKDLELLSQTSEYVKVTNFYLRENKIAVADYDYNTYQSLINTFIAFNFTATDVLRFHAYRSNKEYITLPSETKFKSPKRSLRKVTLRYLNDLGLETLCEDLSHNQRLWRRFSLTFHQNDYNYSVVNVAFHATVHNSSVRKYLSLMKVYNNHKIFDLINNKLVYRSFESRLQSAITNDDVNLVVSMLSLKRGLFGRKLLSLINSFPMDARLVVDSFFSLGMPDVKMLLTLTSLNSAKKVLRMYKVKGKLAFKEITQNTKSIEFVKTKAQKMLKGNLDTGLDVYVSPSVKNYALPLSRHGVNSSLGRMSRIYNDKRYIQFFVNWETYNIDLDLSVCLFDSNFNMVDYYDYNKLSGTRRDNGVKHAGDLRYGPATEYVQVDTHSVNNDVRYIVPMVMNFRGDTFDDVDCKIGWMMSDDREFNFGNIEQAMDLNGDYNFVILSCYDMDNKYITHLDYGSSGSNNVQNVSSNKETIGKIVKGSMQDGHMLVSQLAELLGNVKVSDNVPDVECIYITSNDSDDEYENVTMIKYEDIMSLL